MEEGNRRSLEDATYQPPRDRLRRFRNARNTLCASSVGSLEFAVTQLEAPLIVVMGHEACGALRAAVAGTREQQRQFTGNAYKVLQSLLSTVLEAGPWAPNLVDAAALCNVRKVGRALREEASPAPLEPQRRGALRVVGAYCHVDTGRVDFLDEEK